jgi:hypothetical protein
LEDQLFILEEERKGEKTMEITEHQNFTDKSYQIIIRENEDLNPLEIAESLKNQYPKERAVICFSEKIIQIKIGLLIVGLKLK